jgi:hypothetical protein
MGLARISIALLGVSSAVTAATVTSISGKHGAVASEVGECSQVGLDILKQGGSAADGVRTPFVYLVTSLLTIAFTLHASHS